MFDLAYIRIFIISLIFGLTSLIPSNSNSETHPGGASADLYDVDLTIVNSGNLNFGPIWGGGTATVTSVSSTTQSKTGNLVFLTPGNFSRATFTVTGQSNANYSIGCPDPGTLLGSALVNDNTIGITYICSSDNNGDNATTGLLNTTTDVVGVGGTITTAANQDPGNYTTTFTIDVNYP